jgi:hypothetical protein
MSFEIDRGMIMTHVIEGVSERYKCPTCEKTYQLSQTAIDCCPLEPTYFCYGCAAPHKTMDAAYFCCLRDSQEYACRACGMRYSSTLEARMCCLPEPVFICKLCKREYQLKENAEICYRDCDLKEKSHPHQMGPSPLKTGYGNCEMCRFHKGFVSSYIDVHTCIYLDYEWDKKLNQKDPVCPFKPR